jgi:hypothetical protein
MKNFINIAILLVLVVANAAAGDPIASSQCPLPSTAYCFYYRQIDLNQAAADGSDQVALIQVDSSYMPKFDADDALNFEITSVHTDRLVERGSDSIDERTFELHLLNQSFISLKFKPTSSYLLVNKTVKLKLHDSHNSKCYIVLDFVTSQSPVESEKTPSIVYYETLQYDTIGSNEIELDLNTILPRLICDGKPYSVTCLKCNLSPDTTASSSFNSLALSITQNNTVTAKFDTFKSSQIYKDAYLLVSEEVENEDNASEVASVKHYYILVRIYNLNGNQTGFRDALISKIDRRYKRFSKKSATNSSAPVIVSKQQLSNNANIQYHTGNFNMLKTAQLAITEETIGLQTRLKIYEYVWVDYQLNASDYVRQRIQLIAPDNPILNITRPFDFETGGPLHSFQIIFTRKVDKRTSELFFYFVEKIPDMNDKFSTH